METNPQVEVKGGMEMVRGRERGFASKYNQNQQISTFAYSIASGMTRSHSLDSGQSSSVHQRDFVAGANFST